MSSGIRIQAINKDGLPFPDEVPGIGVIWLTSRMTPNAKMLTTNSVIFAIFTVHTSPLFSLYSFMFQLYKS